MNGDNSEVRNWATRLISEKTTAALNPVLIRQVLIGTRVIATHDFGARYRPHAARDDDDIRMFKYEN